MDKLVLITGASSGIGEACAVKFASMGCRVILNGRSTKRLEELRKRLIDEYSCDCISLPFDVTDCQTAGRMLANLPENYRNIDILVNNAGLALGTDKMHQSDVQDCFTMIDTNVKALYYISRLVVPGMVERGGGHVINIGSIAGNAAYPGGSIYCATKAAVKTLTDGLRMDLYDTCVKVTLIKPGLVETNFSVTRFHGDKAKADAVYEGIKPLCGEDIAEAVYFAASAPEHVQITEIEVMATHQASPQRVYKTK